MPTSYLHSVVHPHQSICIYLHCCTFPPPLCLCLPFCLLLLSLTLWFFSGVLWPWPLSFCPLLCFFVPVAGLFCHDCVSAFVSLCPCLSFSVTLSISLCPFCLCVPVSSSPSPHPSVYDYRVPAEYTNREHRLWDIQLPGLKSQLTLISCMT